MRPGGCLARRRAMKVYWLRGGKKFCRARHAVPLRRRKLRMKGVGGDGADEFVEVGGRGDASELRAGEGGAELEAGAVLGRKLESGGTELFKRMDVAAPEGDIALLFGAQALSVPLTR